MCAATRERHAHEQFEFTSKHSVCQIARSPKLNQRSFFCENPTMGLSYQPPPPPPPPFFFRHHLPRRTYGILTDHWADLDVRTLHQTREVTAYQRAAASSRCSLWRRTAASSPCCAAAPGDLGLDGRIEIVAPVPCSASPGTQPQIVANSETDDRNPAFGTSAAGTLILSYHRTFRYDAAGNYLAPPHQGDLRPTEILITRSHDAGLTWEDPYLLAMPSCSQAPLSARSSPSRMGRCCCRSITER